MADTPFNFMDNKPRQRNQKRWEKGVNLVRVASQLFHEKGYLETSMEDISNAAHLSKGGIYHYFSSKNEILFYISTSYMDLLLKGLEEELRKREDRFSKIQLIISRHIDLYMKYTSEAKTTLHEAHLLPPEYFKKYAEKERRYYRIVANVLSDFFGGRIRKDQLRVMTFTLLGMCNWIYHWYKPKRFVSPQGLSEIISDIFCRGIIGYEMKEKKVS
jgi:AcrR family transcriptional regulator